MEGHGRLRRPGVWVALAPLSLKRMMREGPFPFPHSIIGLKAGTVGCVALVYGSPWHRISLKRIDEAAGQRQAK